MVELGRQLAVAVAAAVLQIGEGGEGGAVGHGRTPCGQVTDSGAREWPMRDLASPGDILVALVV